MNRQSLLIFKPWGITRPVGKASPGTYIHWQPLGTKHQPPEAHAVLLVRVFPLAIAEVKAGEKGCHQLNTFLHFQLQIFMCQFPAFPVSLRNIFTDMLEGL